MRTQITEYKGQPIFTIMRSDDDRFPFNFGVAKAKLILANLPAIQAFVKKHDALEKPAKPVGKVVKMKASKAA